MNIFLPLKCYNDASHLFPENKRPRHSRISFLYILSKMKCVSGIILPLRHFISKKYSKKASMLNVFGMNNSLPQNYIKDAFPFNIPFHPGEGPEVIYPDGSVEPEEDPGDEPDDY
ncbi:hypothetical protein [Ferroplasma sp.]|uniref:hypothetical protein n=1 Tax=Ferroplasma sp. TaxID=2591003 RepID=UPI00261D56D8|nr:hypothetical protein [Ferroplasma sp.]